MRFTEMLRGLAAGVLALAMVASAGGVRAAEDEEPGAGAPAAPEVKAGEAVGGLQATMLLKERTFGQRKVSLPTLQLKNAGEKALVLNFQLGGGGFGGRGGAQEASPVKLMARDAAGKDVPRREQPARQPDAAAAPEERPAVLTVLKPGQTLEQPLLGGLRFPADGKYTIWAEIEVKPAEEVLPGVKPWSGKLKSNELEYDYKGGAGGRRGRNRDQAAPAPAPAPAPAGGKETF